MLKVGQLVDKANDWQIIHGVGNLERIKDRQASGSSGMERHNPRRKGRLNAS